MPCAWLFDGAWVVGGNTAKVRVTLDLAELIERGQCQAVLDVGIVGLGSDRA